MPKNPIREYLEKTGLTQQQLSEATGIPAPMISDWANDVRGPSVDSAFLLEGKTGGQIKASSWVGRPRLKRRRKDTATNGQVTPNDFYGLGAKPARRRKSA